MADNKYHSNGPLTYCFDGALKRGQPVSVRLRDRLSTGFINAEVRKPAFDTKPINSIISSRCLPEYCFAAAQWLSEYYCVSLGEALRQYAPTKPPIRDIKPMPLIESSAQIELAPSLTSSQAAALKYIGKTTSNTVLLHGDTGSGKSRVYIELAKSTLAQGKSVILLTPEIALTSQLSAVTRRALNIEPLILHSQLTDSERKKIWLSILEAAKPQFVIGPRSALFSPCQKLGLIIIDEAHEPAYKQSQSPRYHATRLASQIGLLSGSKVILGTATPLLSDYYLAAAKDAVVEMTDQAITEKKADIEVGVIDSKDRTNFSANPYLSNKLLEEIRQNLASRRQVLIYYNRRGSARLILCQVCGWQMTCPNCDIPLTYHADKHQAKCHVCGLVDIPPHNCSICNNPDIIYKSIGTKSLADIIARLFPEHTIRRFDSDNDKGETVSDTYHSLVSGEVDIIVGTQLLAKGFDLPRLGLVGVVSAETSLALPDFTSEERMFQLLYQVIGRVGRGHRKGRVVVQTYNPNKISIQAAINRNYGEFYKFMIEERAAFRYPPYSYLMKLICKRKTANGAKSAASNLKKLLREDKLPVEILGPAPSFYEKRGSNYHWQLIIKSKDRKYLTQLASKVPSGWTVDLDPSDLL